MNCLKCFVLHTELILDLPVCFLRDQRTGRQRDLATLKLQLQFPHRRSFAQTPFSYTTEPFIFHLFQLSLFGEAVNLEKSCDTEGMGEEDWRWGGLFRRYAAHGRLTLGTLPSIE